MYPRSISLTCASRSKPDSGNVSTGADGGRGLSPRTVAGRLSGRTEGVDSSATARSTTFSDRKSTRLNSSHVSISYAVFCLKKKKNKGRTDVPHPGRHV